MALSKKAKVWIFIISIPILLLVIGVASLKLYMTSERLKALIIPRIEEAISRSVSVKDVSLTILPAFAISIDELRISNPVSLEFDKKEFISLDNIRLKVDILKLLKSKLEINYIIIERPKIYLEVKEDGINNYYIKKEETQKEDTAKAKFEMVGMQALLSNLEIVDGEIEYINKKSDNVLIISGLSQTTKIETKESGNIISIASKSSVKGLSYGTTKSFLLDRLPFSASIIFSFNVENDKLQVEEADLRIQELPLKISGFISGLQNEKMNVDLNLSSPGVQLSHLMSLVPPEMQKTMKGFTSSGDVKFSAEIKGESSEKQTPAIISSFSISDGQIRYTNFPKALTNINVTGKFELPSVTNEKPIGKFQVDKLTALMGGNEISGKLSIVDFDAPKVNAMFNGTVNLKEVKEFYPFEKGTEIDGVLKANVAIEGTVKFPKNTKANGNIVFQNVTVKTTSTKRPLSNLNGTITFNNQFIESKQLAMNIGESDLSIGFSLQNYLALVWDEAKKASGKPTATITLKSRQLKTTDLVSEDNSTINDQDKKQAGQKKAMLLPGLDINATVNIEKLTTDKFEFTNAHGSLSSIDGIIDLKNFSVNAFQGNITTKGTLDLRNENKRDFNLALDIVNVEANSILSKFTSFGRNIFGKLTMDAKLRGDLDDTLGINKQTLFGEGKVQIVDGKLIGFPLMTKIAEFTNISTLREVSFARWSNTFSISNGKINIKELRVNSNAADFNVNGTHGFDGDMNYILNIKLPSSFSEQVRLSGVATNLLQFFKDNDGRLDLNFDVSGTTTNPSLKLNTKAQEEKAQQAVEKEKQKLLEQGKKKVEEGLKKLFKKP